MMTGWRLLRATQRVGAIVSVRWSFDSFSQCIVYEALSTFRAQAFLGIILGCLGGMSFPAISSIKSNNVDEHEQGQIQGALYGARALAVRIRSSSYL